MFTGLIKDIGTVVKITTNEEGKEFEIETKLASDIKVDDSVATNGACLTATKVSKNTYTAQAVHITLEKTSLGSLNVGDLVNLELALRAQDRLGGHFVQGHVGGTARLINSTSFGKNWEIEFELDKTLLPYIVQEGSIAIEGISLTVARLNGVKMLVTIIPHTYENTNLKTKNPGDTVNIEVDILAKYAENIMKFRK